MPVSGFIMFLTMFLPFLLIVPLVMFVVAHRQMARAQTKMAQHIGEIAKKMDGGQL